MACWTKGAWPVSAQGFGGRCFEQAGNQFDHYTVEYTFADGTKLFAFSRHIKGCWETYSDYAHGSKGSAVIMASLGAPKPKIYRSHNMVPDELVWQYPQRDPNPYHAEWQLLLDAIRQDKPHNEARRAGEAEVAALMGRMATHTGQYVTWDQALNSNFQFVEDIDNMTFDTHAPISAGPDGIYPVPQPGITKEI
ncbi:MAG: Gfo/Idh/MocA family oxidoreductase [Planctomycetota bacterium]